MKNTLFALLVLAVASPLAHAQEYGFWGLNMPPPATPPVIHLVRDADLLVANITIVASDKNPETQAADFANGLLTLRQALTKHPAISIKEERTVFGGGEPSVFASSYAGGKFNTQRSASDFKLIHPLNIAKDTAEAAEMLRRLVGALRLPRNVEIRIDSMQIEVSDAQNLRTLLLEAIAADAAKLKSLFKESAVIVAGLQNRIEQRPLNNRQVAVFIPYTLSVGGAQRP